MYMLSLIRWGWGGIDKGAINVCSILQPQPATIFSLSSQAHDGQSGGLSEAHSGMNRGFLVLSCWVKCAYVNVCVC